MTKSLENMTLDELEVTMRNAMSRMDALTYKQTCDALGLIPDVPDLYEKGTAEEEYLRTFEPKEKRKVRKTLTRTEYSSFYCDWQRLHINERNYESDCDEKRKSLLRFHKFRKNGKQPILDYSCSQIGYLYLKILEQAKKSTGQ